MRAEGARRISWRKESSLIEASLAAAVMSALPALAAGQETDWTGASPVSNTSWSAAGNWSAGEPGNGSNAVIAPSASNTFTVSYDYTGAPVTLSLLNINYSPGGASNTLNVANPDTLIAGEEIVGFTGGGAVTQSAGSNTLVGVGLIEIAALQGSTGSYTLSGSGSLSAKNEAVGTGDHGTFIQTGGTNTIGTAGALTIGDFGLSTGTYTLATGGILNAGFEEIVGRSGDGIFNQTGGTNTTSELDLAQYLTATGQYNLSGGTLTINSGIYVGGSGPALYNSAAGPGTFTVNNSGQVNVTGTLTVYNSGQLNVNGGTAGATALNLTGSYAQTAGTATFGQIAGTGSATITGGTTSITGGGISTVGALSVNSGGKLDITGGKLVINYAGSPDPAATVLSEITAGAAFNGNSATWTGNGITSSTAALSVTNPGAFGGKIFVIGYLDGNNTIDNQYGTVLANQIVIQYAVAGDAYLENSVGFHDLLSVAQNYQLTGRDFAQGDFFYNPQGSVGFADLLAVAQSYGQSFNTGGQTVSAGAAVPLAWSEKSTAVPEPGAIAMLAGVGSLLSRRPRYERRRSMSDGRK